MQNMNCPRCGQTLVKSFYQGKVSYHCPQGHGRSLTLSAVRQLCGNPQFANALWRKALEAPAENGGVCPQCGHRMSLIHVIPEGHDVELDICCRCQILWFDPNELEALPSPPPPPEKNVLPARAREILALHAIENENKESSAPDNAWGFLAGVLGFPVERNAPLLNSRPWCTWSIAALCVLAFLLSLGNLPHVVHEWGMIPADCFRHYGLTFLSSMFLHGGFWHLLGNMYFLLIFGDNVEDALGVPLYLGLILAAELSATGLYICFAPDSSVPCVGASGFISGVIAAYAVFFPKVTLSLMYRIYFRIGWVNIPAWGAFALWMLYQGIMALWFSEGSGVAYCSHLGGAVFGLAAGFLMRRRISERLKKM